MQGTFEFHRGGGPLREQRSQSEHSEAHARSHQQFAASAERTVRLSGKTCQHSIKHVTSSQDSRRGSQATAGDSCSSIDEHKFVGHQKGLRQLLPGIKPGGRGPAEIILRVPDLDGPCGRAGNLFGLDDGGPTEPVEVG